MPKDRSKRRLVTRACDQCRKAKRKCDEGRPCSTCMRKGQECTFNYVPRKRGPHPKRSRRAGDSDSDAASSSAGESDISSPTGDKRGCPCGLTIFIHPSLAPVQCVCGQMACDCPTMEQHVAVKKEGGEVGMVETLEETMQLRAEVETLTKYQGGETMENHQKAFPLLAAQTAVVYRCVPSMSVLIQPGIVHNKPVLVCPTLADYHVVFSLEGGHPGTPDLFANPGLVAVTQGMLDLVGLRADGALVGADVFDRLAPAPPEAMCAQPAFQPQNLLKRVQFVLQTMLLGADSHLLAAKCMGDVWFGAHGRPSIVCFRYADIVVNQTVDEFVGDQMLTKDTLLFGGVEEEEAEVFTRTYPWSLADAGQSEKTDSAPSSMAEDDDVGDLTLFWREDELESVVSQFLAQT